MLLRADAAKVEPLHRALGGDAAPGGNGIEASAAVVLACSAGLEGRSFYMPLQ